MLERFFGLEAHGTTIRREILGGATTFASMAYIAVLNPAILAFAGLPIGPETVATILTTVVGCLLMGLWANRPIAVAPYMGENAFLAFGLAGLGIGWQERLGTVFIAGIAFALLVVLRIGPWLARSISPSMKHAFGAGIGFFLLLLGLEQAGLVESAVRGMPAETLVDPQSGLLLAPAVPLKIGDLRAPTAILSILGVFAIVVLQARRVPGAVLIGMVATAIGGWLWGVGESPQALFALPFTGDLTLSPIAFELDIRGVLRLSFLPILLTLFLVSFLDTVGTLVGLGSAANLLDEEGQLPKIERPMLASAAASIFGSLAGTSTSGAFIESATGIREGARTGLAAVTTALLFSATLFCIPLLEPLQRMEYAWAPALIAVGIAMLPTIGRLEFDDPTELVPAIVTISMMVFTFNIANGMTAGLALYPILKTAVGRGREVPTGTWILAAACGFYYAFGLPH